MTTASPSRHLPLLEGYTAEFYDWCKRNELRFQRCARCGTWRHPPRPLCNHCHSFEAEWAAVSGDGTLYCWTIAAASMDPAFASAVPYVAAVVALDEGPRIATWVTDVVPNALRVGMRLQVWFDAREPGVTLPKFKPAA
jgi:uncharacterized OB-fold protein